MRAVAVALALLAGPALAQEGPLTTLMRPQPLERTAPLGRADTLFGETPLVGGDALAGRAPPQEPRAAGARVDRDTGEGSCDTRAGASRRPVPGGLASGGSGLGEYERFVNGGHAADAKPTTPVRRGGDRLLLGGSDRPLWGGEPVPNAAVPAVREGDSGPAATGDARAPVPGVDRPLWADGAAPRADACDGDPGTKRAGTPEPPTQTLFFGMTPPR